MEEACSCETVVGAVTSGDGKSLGSANKLPQLLLQEFSEPSLTQSQQDWSLVSQLLTEVKAAESVSVCYT